MATIYTTTDAANAAATTDQRVIVVRWKSPVRVVAVTIPNDAFVQSSAECPKAYEALIHAVLEDSAKSIIRRHCESGTFTATSIPDAAFSAAALIENATTTHTDWLSKEELTELWTKSATRNRLISDARYSTSTEYRRAVNYFAETVLKFSGKTSQFKERELDTVLAKLDESDLASELGAFIIRRVEAIKNKPAATEIDLDLL